MKMKIFRTCFFSIIFVLSFSIDASADTAGYPANESKIDWQISDEQSQQTEDKATNHTREQIDDLITIVSDGDYDEAEAQNMIERIHSLHDSILQGLVEEDISMFLVNFPITKLDEFSHLEDIVPRGWENTGATWDDVPGAGGKPSIARIGYSESGTDHGSLNLELHEIAHPIDTFVFNEISSSSAFQTIQEQEQPFFLPDVYFKYPNEYFAEAIAYYFLNDGTREVLKQGAPKTYDFIKMLGDTATEETLNQAIEDVYLLDDAMYTAELEETVEAAVKVSNNPEASQPAIRKAEFTLRQAKINATEQMHERVDQLTTIVTKGDYDRAEADQMIERINRIDGSLLQSLVDHEIAVNLVNFPITESTAGMDERTITVPIGYREQGLAENTINLELSEIARAFDRFVLKQNSYSPEFGKIHSDEQDAFLPNSYYDSPENYFAEAFAYYFLSEESKNQLAEQAPETYTFISNLEISSDKEYLHEVINQALLVDEAYHTEGFNRNLTYALDVSNNPYASQFEIDEAAALLHAVLIEVAPAEEAKKESVAETVSSSSNLNTMNFAETNALSYLFISLFSTLFGSILLLQSFFLLAPEELMQVKMPFQK